MKPLANGRTDDARNRAQDDPNEREVHNQTSEQIANNVRFQIGSLATRLTPQKFLQVLRILQEARVKEPQIAMPPRKVSTPPSIPAHTPASSPVRKLRVLRATCAAAKPGKR